MMRREVTTTEKLTVEQKIEVYCHEATTQIDKLAL